MANAMSAPSNFGAPISTLDISNLITTTQRAMEKSYDANLAKVDSLIESYTQIPLVRSSDKQYLGERLQTLLSAVDKNSKINWTSGTAAREVNSYISAAVDDNVLKQMANSQKIINFEQTAAERKAKNPELYNDANYIYAKDKGGYEAYMKGDSNDLGSMQYIDYYDVKKNLTDEVEKFAKDRGFQKVLSQEEGTYVYKTVKGQEVKPEEIENFVKSAISSDSRLQQQLLIDSHAQYRGLKDEQVLEGYSKYINEEAKVYDTRIEALDNEKKNTNKDDLAKIATLENQKTALNEEKNTLISKANPSNFNRDSVQLEHYTKGLINNYAKTYSYSAITDVDYDDTLLQIAKAQGKLAEDGTSATGLGVAGAQIGQQFDVAEEVLPEGDKVSNFAKIESDALQAWSGAVSVIKRNLIAQGKPATNKDIAIYYAGLRKAGKEGFSINSGGYTDEEIDAYNKVTQNNIVLAKATNIAKTQYGAATTEVLNGLFGGSRKGLNKEGLAQTMPYTVSLLDKYGSADQMTKKERAIALIEVANNAKNTIAEDDGDKKYYDLYINSVKRDNNLTNKDLPTVQKSGEQPGFWRSLGEVAAAHGSDLARAAGNVFSAFITDPFKRQEQYKQDIEQANRERADSQQRLSRAYSGLAGTVTSDRNLSEIQSGDINLKNYRDPSLAFKNATLAAKEQIERESEKYRANIPKGKSLILNPDIKAEKPYVAQFANAIIAAGHNPAEGTYINLVGVKDGLATVKYQEVTDSPTATEGVTKKYTVDSTVQIPISNLPPAILSRLDVVQKDFGNSIKNPTPIVRALSYSPPLNYNSKAQFEQDFLKTSGESMSPEDVQYMRLHGMSDIKTKEDYLKEASTLPPAYFERFKQELQSDYKVSWERPEGGGAFIGRIIKNGEEISRQNLQEDYKPHLYKLYTVNYINSYLQQKLKDLQSEYQRTKY